MEGKIRQRLSSWSNRNYLSTSPKCQDKIVVYNSLCPSATNYWHWNEFSCNDDDDAF